MGLGRIKTKIFADGADLDGIVKLRANPLIKGFTTNPTLMRKAGVSDYEGFARKLLEVVPDRPVSFEVLADEFDEMAAQARVIASWGRNVNVKIPVTNTRRQFAGPLIRTLSREGISVNVTAVFTPEQVRAVVGCLDADTPAFVSVFAGRIADAGIDPVPIMAESVRILAVHPKAELIWASPREVLNVIQADAVGCHVITATPDILAKLGLIGKDLAEYSLETVQMFRRDAVAAAYAIGADARARRTRQVA